MNGPEHLGIGVASAGLVLWGAQIAGAHLTLGTALVGAAVAGIGALAPDIDHPQAFIGNRIPMGLLTIGLLFVLTPVALGAAASSGGMFAVALTQVTQSAASLPKWGALLLVVGGLLAGVSIAVTRSIDHRGPVHSLVVGGCATAVSLILFAVLGLAPWFGVLFGLGWLTHLMADAITHDGLACLFWPAIQPDLAGGSKPFGIFLIPLVLFGLTGWAVSAPALLSSSLPRSSGASSTSVAAPPKTASVSLARQRLREASPEIAGALTNPANPVVASNGANTSYTWQYLRKLASNAVVVKTIKVTLDASGHIIGVSGS